MSEKRVTFSVSEQKTNIHKKGNINDRNYASSDLTIRHSYKRSVVMNQCKSQPSSKTENVKKSLVRNFEQAVTKKVIMTKAFREKVPMYGVLKDGNLKSNYSTRYASPELYSTLCVAKRMQQASGKNDQSKDLVIHSSANDEGKATMGAALKLDSPVVRNDVAKRLDFPPDEQLYMGLVALDLHDKGEMDPVVKSKCSVRKHSKKEVVNVKELSSQPVCTPECNAVLNLRPKSTPCPSPIQITDYPMYTATDIPMCTATDVPTYTDTDVPTYTDTDVPMYTATVVPTYTDTDVPTYTDMDVPTYTDMEVPTATDVPTYTDTDVPTYTDTDVVAYTDTDVPTYTATDVPMYTATDVLKDSVEELLYRSRQKQSKFMEVTLEGCELCKDRDISAPGIFELNPECYKCMYPSVDLSNDWFTQLSNSCSNKSESNISTSNTFSKKYPGSNEINPLSSSSCALTCFDVTNSSRSKEGTLPNCSLMEAGSNYTNRDNGSSYKGMCNSRSSSAKSQRTDVGNSSSTSMCKTNYGGKISEQSQHLETTHSKYNSGIIQDNDDTNNLETCHYKRKSERSVGIGNEAIHSSNGSGENNSDDVTREYSIHNDNKYSGKCQESVAIYSHFDTDNHRSNDTAGMYRDIRGTEINFSRYNTGKVGGTVDTGIYKTNTRDTFFAKSQGQTEYRNYNIGTCHSRDDTRSFKSYNDGKFSMHSEGTEADYETFKPIKVCGNDTPGVGKFSVQFQGTEAVSDHSSSITGDVCGTNESGLFVTYNDSKFATESQGTELVSDNRTNEPDRVCGSGGTGLFNTYTDDKFHTKSPGAVTVIKNIYRHHKSFGHTGRIDSTSGYRINKVDDASHGYSLPDQVPTNSSETSSKSPISDHNNYRLSSNNCRPYISSYSSNQASSKDSTESCDMDAHIDSPESHSAFADIVSRYSEYGAPWYYGRSRAFTKLIKSRIGEWTSSQAQFCYSVRQDNTNIISGTVIRHEAEEENSDSSENKSEGDCSEEQ